MGWAPNWGGVGCIDATRVILAFASCSECRVAVARRPAASLPEEVRFGCDCRLLARSSCRVGVEQHVTFDHSDFFPAEAERRVGLRAEFSFANNPRTALSITVSWRHCHRCVGPLLKSVNTLSISRIANATRTPWEPRTLCGLAHDCPTPCVQLGDALAGAKREAQS